MTWNEFLTMIQNKWILRQLKRLKEISAPISVYTDYLEFPYEKLLPEDKAMYNSVISEYSSLRATCWMISKTDLLNEIKEPTRWHHMEEYGSVEDYLNFLFDETEKAISFYEEIVRHTTHIAGQKDMITYLLRQKRQQTRFRFNEQKAGLFSVSILPMHSFVPV